MSVVKNIGAADTPYFTPVQSTPAGTALSANPPTLFTPLKIRDVEFQNRIWVSPMCMYSAENGKLTDFHLVHLGAFAYRGASLTIIEATSVLPNGGITPQDSGLWEDAQIAPIRKIADFLHSQGQKLGIQLGHAGRKASTTAPWLTTVRGKAILATKEAGGWPENVMGASAIPFSEEGFAVPREMSIDEIKAFVQAFKGSAARAVKAGVDVIEIHAAHGYLLSSFLSPLSNRRTDDYGGSFENRIRILLEVIKAVREAIPTGMPLLVRVSATEWMESEPESWNVESTIRLAKLLPALGVDLLDVSSGGNNEHQKIPTGDHTYQTSIAKHIREVLIKDNITNLLVGTVGMITEAEEAKALVENGSDAPKSDTIEVEDEQGRKATADVVLVARQFLREPEWVFRVAFRLGVEVQWPVQYHRSGFRAGSRI